MQERRRSLRARPDDLFVVVLVSGRIRLVPRWEINRELNTYQSGIADSEDARDAIFGRLAAGLPIEVEASPGATVEFMRWCARRGLPIPFDFCRAQPGDCEDADA